MKTVITISAISLIFVYVIVAFVEWQFNPKLWGWFVRFVYAGLAICIAAWGNMAYCDIKDTSKNKTK